MRRPRNKELEKYIAGKQARYLGTSPEDVLGMIDRKGGDYYRSDLYPDQGVMSQAEDDFSTFRTGTPAMSQIADDMRSYYGIGNSQPQKVMTNLPQEIEEQVAPVSEPYVRPQPRPEPQPMPQPKVQQEPRQQQQSVSQQEPPQMRERIMGGLRKAGKAIMDFDTAYAERVERDMGGLNKSPLRVMLGGSPLNSRVENYGETMMETAINNAAIGATYASNIGYRYGLPAAGITLAGKGLYDLTIGMNQQTQGTVEM